MRTDSPFRSTRRYRSHWLLAISWASVPPVLVLAQKPVSFEAPLVYCTVSGSPGSCTNTGPNGLAIADIMGTTSGSNPDGLMDVVICNGHVSSISVFRNKGHSSGNWNGLELALTASLPVTGAPYDVELADIDGDSDLDALVSVRLTTSFGSTLAVFLNPGNGAFTSATGIALSTSQSYGLTAADFDGDGDKDALVAGQYRTIDTFGHPQLVRLLNNGSGSFTQQLIEFTEISQGAATDVLAVNVNPPSGGRLDVIMSTSSTNGEMIVMYNNASSDMTTWSYALPSAVPSWGITFGKIRPGDPRDVVLSDINSTNMRVCLKNTQSPPTYDMQTHEYPYSGLLDPWGLAMGTLNRDSANDVVLATIHGSPPSGGEGHGGIVVFLGKGNSAGEFWENFYSPKYFVVEPLGQSPARHPKCNFVQIADLDDDGANDIITSNNDSGSLSVLINNSPLVAPP